MFCCVIAFYYFATISLERDRWNSLQMPVLICFTLLSAIVGVLMVKTGPLVATSQSFVGHEKATVDMLRALSIVTVLAGFFSHQFNQFTELCILQGKVRHLDLQYVRASRTTVLVFAWIALCLRMGTLAVSTTDSTDRVLSPWTGWLWWLLSQHSGATFSILATILQLHFAIIAANPMFLRLDRQRLLGLRQILMEVSKDDALPLSSRNGQLLDSMQKLERTVLDIFCQAAGAKGDVSNVLQFLGSSGLVSTSLIPKSASGNVAIISSEHLDDQRSFLRNVTHSLRTPLHSSTNLHAQFLCFAVISFNTMLLPDDTGIFPSVSSEGVLTASQRRHALESIVSAQTLLRTLDDVLELCDANLSNAERSAFPESPTEATIQELYSPIQTILDEVVIEPHSYRSMLIPAELVVNVGASLPPKLMMFAPHVQSVRFFTCFALCM